MLDASLPDLLRLVAVPALGWAAYKDVQVRRVPNRLWYPLGALGLVLLVWDASTAGVILGSPESFQDRLFLLRVGVSLGLVAPFSYLVWRFGGFGGADAKALITLAILFPIFPTYVIGAGTAGAALVLPLERPALAVFSMTILTNTVVVAMLYPVGLTVRNALHRDVSPVMFVGTRVETESIPDRHGSLMETPAGLTRQGLDIDALRMYLRWRKTTLSDLQADPARYRNPASLPAEPGDPTDGAIADGGATRGAPDDGAVDPDEDSSEMVDPWGAEAFLDDIGWNAWGTDPEDLRDGLDVLAENDRVWYSPGIPFIVPMFAGLVVGLVYGDVLFGVLELLTLV